MPSEPLPARVEVAVVSTGRRGVIVEVLTEQDGQQDTTWYVVEHADGSRLAYQESQIRYVRQTFKAGVEFLTSAAFQSRLVELRKAVLGR